MTWSFCLSRQARCGNSAPRVAWAILQYAWCCAVRDCPDIVLLLTLTPASTAVCLGLVHAWSAVQSVLNHLLQKGRSRNSQMLNIYQCQFFVCTVYIVVYVYIRLLDP